MSTLRQVTKSLSNAPVLIGADLGTRANEFWMFNGPAGYDYKFYYTGYKSAVEAYKKCPPISAIINRKATALTNGKVWVVDSENKEVTNGTAQKIKALLDKPNKIQTGKHFLAQIYSYLHMFGFTVILPIKPVGMSATEATALWNLPPTLIDIEETQKVNLALGGDGMVKKIVLKLGSEMTELDIDSVVIIRDSTVSIDSLFLPPSRFEGLEQPINNVIGAYESRGELISYAGSQGLISSEHDVNGPLPIKEEDKLGMQEDFKRLYGIRKGQFRYIITSASVKFQQMGMKTKDLLLIEEVEASTKAICDKLVYPPHLMGIIDPTFNNQELAAKWLYQNAIIPDSENIFQQLTSSLFNVAKYGISIIQSFSHIAELQKDKVSEANARKLLNEAKKIEFEAGLITLDQWLEALGEDPLPNGLGQVRYADTKNTNVPLAVTIGVGGVQGLIGVITAQGMSDSSRQATLEIVFGLSPENAARMAQSNNQNQSDTQNQQQQ